MTGISGVTGKNRNACLLDAGTFCYFYSIQKNGSVENL
jgi:hypothetical protein